MSKSSFAKEIPLQSQQKCDLSYEGEISHILPISFHWNHFKLRQNLFHWWYEIYKNLNPGIPHNPSMHGIFAYIYIVDFYGKNPGTVHNTSLMDPMGIVYQHLEFDNQTCFKTCTQELRHCPRLCIELGCCSAIEPEIMTYCGWIESGQIFYNSETWMV